MRAVAPGHVRFSADHRSHRLRRWNSRGTELKLAWNAELGGDHAATLQRVKQPSELAFGHPEHAGINRRSLDAKLRKQPQMPTSSDAVTDLPMRNCALADVQTVSENGVAPEEINQFMDASNMSHGAQRIPACHTMQHSNLALALASLCRYMIVHMIDPDDCGDHAKDVARRLRLTRVSLGIEDQQDFGEAAGVSQSLYNRFETGSRLLTLQAALKLCLHYDLTLDWLYRGDPSGLPYKLATSIREHRRKAR